MKGAFITLILIGGLALGGCSVAVHNFSAKEDASSAQVDPTEFRSMPLGVSKDYVISQFGKPESSDDQTVGGYGSTLNSSCIYYGVLSQNGSYQFCFDNGQLTAKSRY
jgi:hypothetical protein